MMICSGGPVPLHQFPEEFKGGLAISVLVTRPSSTSPSWSIGAPEVVAFAVDSSRRPRPGASATAGRARNRDARLRRDLGGEESAEPHPPLADRSRG